MEFLQRTSVVVLRQIEYGDFASVDFRFRVQRRLVLRAAFRAVLPLAIYAAT
jgi:hypothetical protein